MTILRPENFFKSLEHASSTQFRPSNRGPGPTPGTPVSQLFTPPPPRERRENNFYWPLLPGNWQTSGAVLWPEHVSLGGLRRGRGGQIAGKPGFDAPSSPVASPLPHPTKKMLRPAATPSDPQAPPLRRARCHVTTPPLKHRRNAGRRAADGIRTSPPRPGLAGRGRVPRVRAGGRRAEGGLGGGPERATKASAPVAVVPERAGAQFSGPREGWGGTRAPGCPPRPQAPPRAPGRPATAAPRTGPRGLPPPRGARARPARSSLALPRSLALARPPSWIRASSPRAAAAAFPLSRPPPPSPPPALTSAAHPGAAGRRPSFPPKVSGVLFPMWGGCYGVVAGGSGAGAAPSTELQS